MASAPAHLAANALRFSGFSTLYNSVRPTPPVLLTTVLTQLLGKRPAVVADIGCGTGLSTFLWDGNCASVIGIDPSESMLEVARSRVPSTTKTHFRFLDAHAHETGLASNSVDIITVSQALHWMSPTLTFPEFLRILRPGGIFAAFDCNWPPTISWQSSSAYSEFMTRSEGLEKTYGTSKEVVKWDKEGHLTRLQDSKLFTYAAEFAVHSIESGNVDRLIGLAKSQGGVAALIKAGVSDEELGVPELRARVVEGMGEGEVPWYWTYRVRYAVK